MKKEDSIFLIHILQNIEAAESFSKNKNKGQLNEDIKTLYAVIRAIEVMGEAARNVSNDLRHHHPEIPWKKIIGTRDKLIHHYFGVDIDLLYDVIKNKLPELKQQIKEILQVR